MHFNENLIERLNLTQKKKGTHNGSSISASQACSLSMFFICILEYINFVYDSLRAIMFRKYKVFGG